MIRLLLSLFILACLRIQAVEPIDIANAHYRLRLDGLTGDLESLVHNGRELIHRGGPRSLFSIRLRKPDGSAVDLPALAAKGFAHRCERDVTGTVVHLDFQDLAGQGGRL